MNILLQLIPILMITFGLINIVRMTSLLIGSDIYSLKKHFRQRKKGSHIFPKISVVIPAFNESRSITKTLESLTSNKYPHEFLEIIVVDDGSIDDTYKTVKEFMKSVDAGNIILVRQENHGKAHALNNGMKNYTNGELVMCLDADSYLDPDALIHGVKYFQDNHLVALAANVKIAPAKGLLNLVQQFEYLVCYQMKKAQTQFNIEYIIGGIGSLFRKSYLEEIGFYDTNTVTEDIDLTMKIIKNGNKKNKIMYASDMIAYTQSVRTIKELIKQRSRWKWGRYQTFFKNKHIFFSADSSFTRGLSWIYLPYALVGDIAFFFEPLILGYLLITTFIYHDAVTLLSAFMTMSFYTIMNILAEETLSIKQKSAYLVRAPLMYFLFYILSYVEYLALIKSVTKLHTVSETLELKNNRWTPVNRIGFSI